MGVPNQAGGNWGSLVRAKGSDGPASQDVVTITYHVGPPTGWDVQLPIAPTFTSGASIRILGVQQNPITPNSKINGTWNVTSITGDTVFIRYDQANPQAGFIANTGTVQEIQLIAKPYTNWLFDGTSHRKRGIPSDRPHGRRKRSVPTAVV